MRAAVIENGVVTNIIEVGALDVFPDMTLVEAINCDIGDTWDGVQFIPQVKPIAETMLTQPPMTDAERDALILAQSEMIALLFERLQGGSAQ